MNNKKTLTIKLVLTFIVMVLLEPIQEYFPNRFDIIEILIIVYIIISIFKYDKSKKRNLK